MKKKSLWIIIGIVLAVGIFVQAEMKLMPATESRFAVESSAELAASSFEAEGDLDTNTPTITLVNDHEGVAVQEVSIGKRDYVAEITVPFRYEQQYGKAVVTEIGKATAKNIAGWFRVNQDASEGTKQVGSGNGGTKAVVYVAYEASIGQGWQTYDDLIEIDLRNI